MNANFLFGFRQLCLGVFFGAVFLAASTQSAFAADTTKPVVGEVSPLVGTQGVVETFSVSYSDDVGVVECTLYMDGPSWGAMELSGGKGSTSGTASLAIAPPDNGPNSAYVICTDAEDNAGTGDTVYVVAADPDVTAPSVGTVTPLTATVGAMTTLKATYSDAVGVSSCDLSIAGTSVGLMTLESDLTTGKASYDYTPSASGSFSVVVICKDDTGNSGSGTSATLVVSADTTAPTVSALTPTTAIAGTAVTLTTAYSDNVGVSSCTLYVGGVNQGAMTLDGAKATKSYTFSASGTFSAKATCLDAAGNSKSGTVASIVVAAASSSSDTTAPVVGSITPTTGVVGVETTVSTTYSDAVGVTACSLHVGSDVLVMTLSSGKASYTDTFDIAGSFSVFVVCVDAAGNTGTGSTVTLTVSAASTDTTAPTVGSISPLTAIAGVSTVFSTTYSDAVGVVACTGYVDGSGKSMALSSGTASATGLFDAAGSYTAYASCVDAAGNVGTGASVTIVVSAASTGTTAPTVGSVSPTTATQNSAATFSVTATDASGIYGCYLMVDGNAQGAMTASSSTYSRSYTPASSGTLSVYAWCGDAVGNIGTGSTVSVTVAAAAVTATDAVAPTVGAITPLTATEDTAVTLYASAADAGGMGTCTLYVNSTNIGSMSISGGYASRSYTFTAAGDAVANAYCVDAAGNATRGASSTITISAAVSSEEEGAVSEADIDTLIKLACGTDADVEDPCHAVYYFDGKRHAFPNEKVYFTWYESFDDVIVVTADFLSSITLGLNVTYHPGTTMVKFVSQNTVYAVGEAGELRAVASEDVASSIWGSDWNTQIDDISDAFYGNYTFGDDIKSTSDFDPDAVESSVTNIIDILQA